MTSSPLAPSTDASTYLSSPQALADLRTINAQFIHNFVTNDVAAHDALLHPDFITIQSNGSVLDRAVYLAQWASGFDPDVIPVWETRGESINVIGDVALVRSTNVFTVVLDGKETHRATLYTDTYLYLDGRWQCLQAQLTAVAPEHVAPPETVVSLYVRGEKVVAA